MSISRQHGTEGENGAVKLMKAIWPACERRKENGAKDRGDINPGGYPVPKIVIEAKYDKSYNFSGWLKEAEIERQHADADFGIVVAKRKGYTDPKQWYAVMTGETLVELLRKAGYSYGE